MKNRIFSISATKRFVASIMAFLLLSQSAMALTFTVDNTGDGSDAAAGNGVCDTGGAVCTLRAAIEEANARASGDTIDFGVGAATVTVGSSLSVAVGNFTLQNSSGNAVGLDGNNGAYDILTVSGDNLTIDGNDNLYFYNSSSNGITLTSAAENISISDVTVGLDAAGTIDATNAGISVQGDDVLIDSSVISGNTQDGVVMGDGVSDVTISNNIIGLDSTGAMAKANSNNGIKVNPTVGAVDFDGDAGGTGGQGLNIDNNTISGNTDDGITIGSGATQNIDGTITINDNEIGTNAAGTAAVANGGDGIDGTELVVGDWTVDDNTISGNTENGISIRAGNSVTIIDNEIGFNAAVTGAVGNTYDGISVDGTTVTITGNAIGNNGYSGISVNNGDDLVTINITNNDIGYTDNVPNTDFGNTDKGISITSQNASTVNMNADLTTTANKIAYNNSAAVSIGNGPTSFVATGNVIGLKDTGGGVYNAAAANASGFAIAGDNLTTVTIGGVDATDDKNLIKDGITISNTAASAAITIKNNYVGVGTGNTNVGTAGVSVSDGNTVDVISNVIGNSTGDGILIGGGVTITIQGNSIGVGANGTTAMANTGDGIDINAATVTSVLIGTNGDAVNDAGEINVVTANGESGIEVADVAATTSTVTIKGNYVGIAADGTTVASLGNTVDGIKIMEGAVTLGGTNTIASGTLGQGNIISNNTATGVLLGTNVTSATVSGNVIGLKKDGSSEYAMDAGNGSHGFYTNSSGLASLTIGATGAGNGNVISGNASSGISLSALAAAAVVSMVNNYIGLNFDGDAKVANDIRGVIVNSGNTVTIGGTSSAERNVISGNTGGGINFDSGFSGTGNVLGNYIGLNAAGTAAIDGGNTSGGISISAGTVNIGNGSSGAGNVISGNKYVGISAGGGTVNIKGNYVGLDATGESAIGNGVSVSDGLNCGGILITGGTVTVGGSDLSDANKRNVISGNYGQGVLVALSNAVIDGNYIGTDKDGASDVGNVDGATPVDTDANGSGITVVDMDGSAVNGTVIGGTTPNTNGNVISGNAGNGISIVHAASGLGQNWTSKYIKEAVLGFAANRTTAIANDGYGIYVEDTSGGGNISNLQLGGSSNYINTTSNYGVYLVNVLSGALYGGYDWVSDHNAFTNPAVTWQAVVGGVSQIAACGDGVDNDQDGLVDTLDAGCTGVTDTDETNIGDGGGGGGGGGSGSGTGTSSTSTSTATASDNTDTASSEESTGQEVSEEVSSEEVSEEVSSEEVSFEEVASEEVENVNNFAAEMASVISETIGTETTEITSFEVDNSIANAVASEVASDVSVETPASVVQNMVMETITGELDVAATENSEQVEQARETAQEISVSSLESAVDSLDEVTVTNSAGETVVLNGSDIDNVEVLVAPLYTEGELEQMQGQATEEGRTVFVVDTSSDMDNDGMPDMLELSLGTMWAENQDQDDYNDLDEYFLDLDLLEQDSVPEEPKMTSRAGTVSSNNPILWFSGLPGDTVNVMLVDVDGVTTEELKTMRLSKLMENDDRIKKIDLGNITISENNKALLASNIPDGNYYVIAKGSEGIGDVKKLVVNGDEDLKDPEVRSYIPGVRTDCRFSLKWVDFLPQVEMNCSFVEEKPGLVIVENAAPGTLIQATWQSVILNSVVLSDASQVEIEVPDDLPEGDHEVIVYAYDPVMNVMSGISRLLFRK